MNKSIIDQKFLKILPNTGNLLHVLMGLFILNVSKNSKIEKQLIYYHDYMNDDSCQHISPY